MSICTIYVLVVCKAITTLYYIHYMTVCYYPFCIYYMYISLLVLRRADFSTCTTAMRILPCSIVYCFMRVLYQLVHLKAPCGAFCDVVFLHLRTFSSVLLYIVSSTNQTEIDMWTTYTYKGLTVWTCFRSPRATQQVIDLIQVAKNPPK